MQNKIGSASIRALTGWIGYRRRGYEAKTSILDKGWNDIIFGIEVEP